MKGREDRPNKRKNKLNTEKEYQEQQFFLLMAFGKLALIAIGSPLIVGVIITRAPLSDWTSLPLFGAVAIVIAVGMLMTETRFLHWMKKSYGMSKITAFIFVLTLLPILFLSISNSIGAFVVLSGFYAGAFAAEIIFQLKGETKSK